ncbi:sigma-70 family RNA polymerase sigma factor [soil metagenome]
MSAEYLWERVRMALRMLTLPSPRRVRAGRPREAPAPPVGDGAASGEGFAQEALPWLDAVHSFALRLTRGDRDAAEDLVQETFLRAHRFWNSYERGTNMKSWLFTICRNTYLHEQGRSRVQRETTMTDLDASPDAPALPPAFGTAGTDPEREFFTGLIDEEVVEAIDALHEEFREVLVLSDLGDLTYSEISEVLGVPIGTVKSRLFRARRSLQESLLEYAVRTGVVRENDR